MQGTQNYQVPNTWGSIFNNNLQPVDSIPATKWHKMPALTRIIQQQHTPYAEPSQVSKGLTQIAAGGTLVAFNSVLNQNVTLADKIGLVSTNVFPSDSVTDNTLHTTAGTSPSLVPGATLTSFIVHRTVNVLINVFAFGRNDNYTIDGSSMQLLVVDTSALGTPISFPVDTNAYLNSINQGTSGVITGWSYNTNSVVVDTLAMITMSAGTHTLTLNFNVNGTGTARLSTYQLSYVVLGQ